MNNPVQGVMASSWPLKPRDPIMVELGEILGAPSWPLKPGDPVMVGKPGYSRFISYRDHVLVIHTNGTISDVRILDPEDFPELFPLAQPHGKGLPL